MMTQRSILWIACLILATGLAAVWGQLPLLDSSPLLRVGLFAGLGLLCFPLVLLFPDLDRRQSATLLVAAAVILRVTLIPAPVSDDVNRYLWEGKLVLAGENPFAALADDPRWIDYRDDFWEDMNHRDRPTAYPPGIQWIMAGAVAVAYHPLSMKALALSGDLATLILLLRLLHHGSQPIRWAGFYAFNPVVLMAFAAEAHFDSLMVAALVGMILSERFKRPIWTWLLFGFAIQIKLVCLVLAPLLVNRSNLRSLWALGLVLILPTLPFLSELDRWWQGVTTFGGSGCFNGPLLTALCLIGIPLTTAKNLTTTCFVLIAIGIWTAKLRGLPFAKSSFFLLSTLLVCSPIVHFWYLTWILPFVALMPSFGWMSASVMTAGYFLAWRTQDLHGWWGYNHTTAALLWLPAAIAFFLQNRQLRARLRAWMSSPEKPPSGKRIGIVIPTLNPGPTLHPLIDTLRQPSGLTLVVADATPPHEELTPFNHSGCNCIAAPLGRGNQIAAGIQQLDSDWILIAHGDATPARDWHGTVSEAIQRHPSASMLVLGQRFTPTGKGTAIIEGLNELRVIFGGVAFGDQTMVIRKSALDRIGGFPEQPLMEDVEVSLRLQAEGPIIYVGGEWQVCARKWQSGFCKRVGLILRLMTTYQLVRLGGRDKAKSYSARLYQEYYGPEAPSG